MPAPSRRRKFFIGCGVLVLLLTAFLGLSGLGKDIWNLRTVIASMLSGDKERSYTATRTNNLKAIYTAMSVYQDSEGQFPVAAGWMDAIQSRIRTSDMKQEEAEKKLVRPDLPPNPGVYGYAMNDAAGGKYAGDLKDKTMPLVYESDETARNAHGDPAKVHRKMAITIQGKVLRLP